MNRIIHLGLRLGKVINDKHDLSGNYSNQVVIEIVMFKDLHAKSGKNHYLGIYRGKLNTHFGGPQGSLESLVYLAWFLAPPSRLEK